MRPAPGIALEDQPAPALAACALVAEAANDGEFGMTAVMEVLLNRMAQPERFGDGLKAVIFQPWAFSSLNPFVYENGQKVPNPLRARLLDLWEQEPQSYALAEGIVSRALTGTLEHTVDGATHYCTNGAHGTLALWGHDDSEWIAKGHHPRWYSQQCIDSGLTKECAVVGRQTFGTTA